MNPSVPTEHAFAIERAIRAYLAATGQATIPCHELTGRNEGDRRAPISFRRNSKGAIEYFILPDLILLPDFSAIEIKTQGYAPYFRMAQTRTTGIKTYHYRSYRQWEQFTGRPVSMAFVHLQENEIRGGTLDAIEPQKTDILNVSRTDQVYWNYDKLPPFFPNRSLADVLTIARTVEFGRETYTADDHGNVVSYINQFAKPNQVKHQQNWSEPVSAMVKASEIRF